MVSAFPTTSTDPSLVLVLLSKSSKMLDHRLRRKSTVYCFEILWIGYIPRYRTDSFAVDLCSINLSLTFYRNLNAKYQRCTVHFSAMCFPSFHVERYR